jgi:2-amino-4-hydroxy-6-hydroxymethyldihydropteridine diphosphokinase
VTENGNGGDDGRYRPVLLGLGANLPHAGRSPRETLAAALARLAALDVPAVATSRWYRTRPVPASDQPAFVNGVAVIRTGLDPDALLALLHRVEAAFGRRRGVRFAARSLDLDLLAVGNRVIDRPGGLQLPHPRLHERAFVLIPLVEVAPEWRHPLLGRTARDLLAALPPAALAGVAPIS